MPGRAWTIEELGWLYEQYLAGVSKQRLAEQTGRSWRSVALQLQSAGLTVVRPFVGSKRAELQEAGRQKDIRQDQRFQEAMYAAGYRPRVVKEPGTERPRPVRGETYFQRTSVTAGF